MKKTAMLLLVVLISGCGHINGVKIDRLHDAGPKEYSLMALGAVTSFGVHWVGHAAYLEMNGIDWHQDGCTEQLDERITNGKLAAMGRAGFVSQLTIGILLNMLWPDSYFTDGYDVGTFAEVVGYPINDNGDLRYIDYDGYAWLEWAGYSAAAGVLLIK